MEAPTLLSRAPLMYTDEAQASNVHGIALVKCIINLDGSVSDCTIVKGLPYMDAALLASVQQWKYTPINWCGHTQRVQMIIPIRVTPEAARQPPRN
jgi:protein TonB